MISSHLNDTIGTIGHMVHLSHHTCLCIEFDVTAFLFFFFFFFRIIVASYYPSLVLDVCVILPHRMDTGVLR